VLRQPALGVGLIGGLHDEERTVQEPRGHELLHLPQHRVTQRAEIHDHDVNPLKQAANAPLPPGVVACDRKHFGARSRPVEIAQVRPIDAVEQFGELRVVANHSLPKLEDIDLPEQERHVAVPRHPQCDVGERVHVTVYGQALDHRTPQQTRLPRSPERPQYQESARIPPPLREPRSEREGDCVRHAEEHHERRGADEQGRQDHALFRPVYCDQERLDNRKRRLCRCG
jgi:hypothetical protein